MAPSERSVLDLPVAPPPTCGECGAVIGNVETHTRWHAGSDQTDLRLAIVDFLDQVDPAQLSKAALELDDDDPVAGVLTVLKDLAVRIP